MTAPPTALSALGLSSAPLLGRPGASALALAPPLPLQGSIDELIAEYRAFAVQLAVFAVTTALVYAAGRLLAVPTADRLLNVRRANETARRAVVRLVRALVVVAALLAGLTAGRLNGLLSASATLAAAATVAVGFASRDVLGNLVGGVFIVTDSKFNIGDWIDWGGHEGIIEDISFRVTRVRTFHNELITVPNSQLASTVVTNHSIKDTLRLDQPFNVDPEGDVDAVREVLLEEADRHPSILDDPAPDVTVETLSAGRIELTARFWIASPTRSKCIDVRSQYVDAVRSRFGREGLELSPESLELTGELAVSHPNSNADATAEGERRGGGNGGRG